jgi:site-specific recombinase
MLRRACGGGLVIAGTTFLKFAIAAVTLSAFWAGFWAGANYAASFVLVHLLHWTVATKQPAMTAPAMAAKLEGVGGSDAATEDFVDEVTHLIRTQIAGILGNVLVVVPVVLLVQGAAWLVQGTPLIDATTAHHVLDKLTLLGPTLAYATFTGVLLFLSSLIAGWWENWFVFHRLDSAIACNPRFVHWLGRERAQRWSGWWRQNISGLAANCSLGMLLGLVPVLATFFGLPIEVRHVTLSAGQIAAALGTLGLPVLHEPAFWWCVAAVPLTGLLNVLVSFTLAFRLALRSRGLQVRDRGRLYAALRRRLRTAPGSFVRPG